MQSTRWLSISQRMQSLSKVSERERVRSSRVFHKCFQWPRETPHGLPSHINTPSLEIQPLCSKCVKPGESRTVRLRQTGLSAIQNQRLETQLMRVRVDCYCVSRTVFGHPGKAVADRSRPHGRPSVIQTMRLTRNAMVLSMSRS